MPAALMAAVTALIGLAIVAQVYYVAKIRASETVVSGRLIAVSAAVIAVLALGGCSSPPPALPTSVLSKGEAGLSEKHPKLTATQRKNCKVCHREVPDPVQQP